MSKRLLWYAALCAATSIACGQTVERKISSPNTEESQSMGALSLGARAATLRARVEELRIIADQNPSTSRSREASLAEFQTLLLLAPQRDTVLEKRRHLLVEKLKKDEAIPRDKRAQLASLSANVDIGSDLSLKPEQRMHAYAEAAWKQLEEFPENNEQYAALLRIARDGGDALAMKIAGDLLASPAPDEFKRNARTIQARGNLIGKSIVELFDGKQNPLEVENNFTLFTWSGEQLSAFNLVKLIRQAFPEDTVVAVCLDKDPSAAKAVAVHMQSEARIIFPEGGVDGAICRQLLLDGPAIYRVDGRGIITTISGISQLAESQWQRASEARP
ncbi:MAG: hypothetical protein QM760_15765 [Nibricoccus sp.]